MLGLKVDVTVDKLTEAVKHCIESSEGKNIIEDSIKIKKYEMVVRKFIARRGEVRPALEQPQS